MARALEDPTYMTYNKTFNRQNQIQHPAAAAIAEQKPLLQTNP
jgi:hypothetical protein